MTKRRKTLRARARKMAKNKLTGLVGMSGSERITYECAYFCGVLAGYRAGKREGKAEAMKACGWGEPGAALRDRRKGK